MYRRWKESKRGFDSDDDYVRIIRKQVEASRAEAEKDGVVVPTTLEEYCIKTKARPSNTDALDSMDFYDEYYDYGDDDDDLDGEGELADDNDEDSGQGES